MIVAPKAVLSNWVKEFREWAPALQALLYDGYKDERRDMRDWVLQDGKFNVLLTHYDLVIRDRGVLQKARRPSPPPHRPISSLLLLWPFRVICGDAFHSQAAAHVLLFMFLFTPGEVELHHRRRGPPHEEPRLEARRGHLPLPLPPPPPPHGRAPRPPPARLSQPLPNPPPAPPRGAGSLTARPPTYPPAAPAAPRQAPRSRTTSPSSGPSSTSSSPRSSPRGTAGAAGSPRPSRGCN